MNPTHGLVEGVTSIDEAESAPLEVSPGSRFFVAVIVLLAVYVAIEIVYVSHVPLVMDEFNYASQVHDLKNRVPYRDFTPTKTVLGYYVQRLALFLTDEPWTGLILIKIWMAVVNAAVIGLGAFLLTRIFRPTAILCALALLVSMSTFLERSAAVRVDMMTGLCGFLSLIFLLRRKTILAGVFCTLSFLMSQKGVFYVLAGNCTLAVCCLFHRRGHMRELLVFNVAMALTLAAYFAFWSCFAPFSKVYEDTFLQELHYTMALNVTHGHIRKFWFQTLARNPAFYGFGLGTLALLALRCRGRTVRRETWVLLVYFSAFPWMVFQHYHFPPLYVPVVAAGGLALAAVFVVSRDRIRWFDWRLLIVVGAAIASMQSWTYAVAIFGLGMLWPIALKERPEKAVRKEWILLVYCAALGALCLWHKHPWPYFFVLFIPHVFLLHAYLFDRLFAAAETREVRMARRTVFGLAAVLGIALPLSRVPRVARERTKIYAFQRETVGLGTQLVKPGETYVDGINMLYTIPQTVEGTRWLGALGKIALKNMSYEELMEVVRELDRKPVKLVVHTYRLPGAPRKLLVHFVNTFDHLWGNIFIYSPRITPEENEFFIKFAGTYRVAVEGGTTVTINGRKHSPDSVIRLVKGPYHNASGGAFRLHFMPEGFDKIADPRFQKQGALYIDPYSY